MPLVARCNGACAPETHSTHNKAYCSCRVCYPGGGQEEEEAGPYQLLMEERMKDEDDKFKEEHDDNEESHFLSRFPSKWKYSLDKGEAEEPTSSAMPAETRPSEMEEIRKELRSVRRQNVITHCLLTVMIGITAFWQISEVSLLLKAKEKLSNPLQTVGNVIRGSLTKDRYEKPVIEVASLPPVGVPELPHLDLPTVTLNVDKD